MPVLIQRRTLLGASVAGGTAALAGSVAGCSLLPGSEPPRAEPVTPLRASDVVAGLAVAAHPAFLDTAYADVGAWVERLAGLGVRTLRGTYNPDNPGCQDAVEACRRLGVRWIMLVVPEAPTSPTDQELERTASVVRTIARTCPDVCAAIEGVNEPDHNRGGGAVPGDWAQVAADHQEVISGVVRESPSLAGIEVIGPSLHDVATAASYREADPAGGPRHLEQLADTGIGQWQDAVGLHSYANGAVPLTGLDERLARIRDAFGEDVRVHVTETGYQDATDGPKDGARPASDAAVATYVVRAALQLAQRGLPFVWYELLDRVVGDPAETDAIEGSFGLLSTPGLDPATWSPKPAALALRSLIASLGGPGQADDDRSGAAPEAVSWGVDAPDDSGVASVLTVDRRGAVRAHLFRDVAVWDPETRTPLDVDEVEVRLLGVGADRTVRVGADVVAVDL